MPKLSLIYIVVPVLMLSLALQSFQVNAQERILTVGFQFKPIIPSNLFRSGSETLLENGHEYTMKQRFGYTGGMVIRRGFTRYFSLETGINYVKRSYTGSILSEDASLNESTDFSIVGYEVPVLGLVYIKLSNIIYMNAAFGLSLDMFPSDVATGSEIGFSQFSIRNSWVQTALLANVGWEYRSRKSGIFYLGASFHRPFTYSYKTQLKYETDTAVEKAIFELSGNYLTLDFRYFFHEEPLKRKPKKQKEDKESRSLWRID